MADRSNLGQRIYRTVSYTLGLSGIAIGGGSLILAKNVIDTYGTPNMSNESIVPLGVGALSILFGGVLTRMAFLSDRIDGALSDLEKKIEK
jgi:ABC-type Fe3+ transport system permease subunit